MSKISLKSILKKTFKKDPSKKTKTKTKLKKNVGRPKVSKKKGIIKYENISWVKKDFKEILKKQCQEWAAMSHLNDARNKHIVRIYHIHAIVLPPRPCPTKSCTSACE